MRYLSVCSGIEAATVAWHPLGWEAAAFSEIEAFPRAVLQHHYPDVPLHGDFTQIKGDEYGPIDLLVGGTPCQSFSVAGLRGGLGDDRGNLALEYLRLADRARPRWLVWENVPGVLSSLSHPAPDPCEPPPPMDLGCDGAEVVTLDDYHSEEVHAFECFLAGLQELGYGFAYRVLDAQFFGVPQRRRRVFVVGHLGDWRRAAAVLFERHSLSGDTPPRREKGQNDPTIPSRSTGGGGLGTDFDCDGGLFASTGDTAHCLNAGGMGRQDYETETLIAHSLRAEGFDASEDGTGRGTPLVPCYGLSTQQEPKWADNISPTLTVPSKSGGGQPTAVCFTAKDYGADASDISPTLRSGSHDGSHANGGVMPAVAFTMHGTDGTATIASETDVAGCIRTKPPGSIENSSTTVALQSSAVRRLTPEECEKLQGFEPGYTAVAYRGKPAADGNRYRALGNSMAIPVMAWIGERIAMVEAIASRSEAA